MSEPELSDGWGWIELRRDETGDERNSYDIETISAGIEIFANNVHEEGEPLDGEYWVTAFNGRGEQIGKSRIDFEDGEATDPLTIKRERPDDVARVGVSIPPDGNERGEIPPPDLNLPKEE